MSESEHAAAERDFLLALGRVTSSFAFLEGNVEFFIWTLLNPDQFVGQIITAELSFKIRLSVASSLFRHLKQGSPRIEELETLLRRAVAAEEKRNIIVHSQWASGDTPESRTRFKRTAKRAKGLQHHFEQMTAKDLHAIADEITAIANELPLFLLAVLRDAPETKP